MRIAPSFLIAIQAATVLAAGPALAQTPPTSPSPPPAPPPEISPLLKDALADVRAERIEEALAKLEGAREQGLESPEKALLGALYVETGQLPQAFEILQPLAEREDSDPAVLYNAGRAALELGRIKIAEAYLTRAVQSDTATPAIRLLGLMHMRAGRVEEAYGLLIAWASMDIGDFEARSAAIFCAIDLGRLDEASALIADLPPEDPRVAYLRGRLRAHQGRHEDAILELKPHIDFILAPPEGEEANLQSDSGLVYDILAEFGRAMLATGQGAGSVDALQKATEYRADQKEAWQLLGQALVAAGRNDEAQTALRQYQELAEKEVAARKAAAEEPPPGED